MPSRSMHYDGPDGYNWGAELGPESPDPARYDETTHQPAAGYRWCPECNGAGTVTVMQPGPNLDEYEYDCGFPGCKEGCGIVPADR